MQSVLNVRMDASLKKRGDKVLAANGISVSCAVRSLWEELARTRTIPDFIKNSGEAAIRKQKRSAALQQILAIAELSPSNNEVDLGTLSKDELRDIQYEDKWDRYEALK